MSSRSFAWTETQPEVKQAITRLGLSLEDAREQFKSKAFRKDPSLRFNFCMKAGIFSQNPDLPGSYVYSSSLFLFICGMASKAIVSKMFECGLPPPDPAFEWCTKNVPSTGLSVMKLESKPSEPPVQTPAPQPAPEPEPAPPEPEPAPPVPEPAPPVPAPPNPAPPNPAPPAFSPLMRQVHLYVKEKEFKEQLEKIVIQRALSKEGVELSPKRRRAE